MWKWLLFVGLLLVMLVPVRAQAGTWSFDVVTDSRTRMVEGRAGYAPAGTVWEWGALGKFFTRLGGDEGTPLFGVGLFAKLRVDPNASVPLANWLPAVGTAIGLPESIKAEVYLLGKLEALPYNMNNVDVSTSVGPGFKVGPVLVEYTYTVIESGDAASEPGGPPVLFSGSTLWFGLEPLRF